MKKLLLLYAFALMGNVHAQKACCTWDVTNQTVDLEFKNDTCVVITGNTSNESMALKGKQYALETNQILELVKKNETGLNIIFKGDTITDNWQNNEITLNIGNSKLTIQKNTAIDSVEKKPEDRKGYESYNKKVNIFYDALTLTNGRFVKDILNKYKVDKNNLFIDSKYFSETQSLSDFKGVLKTFGNLEVTPLADGVAKFLVSRVKKELSIAFFQGFKESIKDDKYIDLRILFPTTYDQLNLIDDKIYDIQPYISDLRKSATNDFKILPFQLSELLAAENSNLAKSLSQMPELKYGLGLSFNLIDEIHNHKNFGKSLEKLSTTNNHYYKDTLGVSKIKEGIELLRLFSFALRDSLETDSTYYLTAEKIEMLANTPSLLNNFIGLAIAASKLEGQNIALDATLYSKLNTSELAENLLAFSPVIEGFKDASASFTKAQNQSGEEKIILYFNSVSKILETSKVLVKFAKFDKTEIDPVLYLFIKSSNLVKTIYTKNYSSAVLQIMDYYHYLHPIKSSKKDKIKLVDPEKVREKIYKYGSFLAQLSQMDSSADVEQLLEQYAAPVGSYRDKSLNKITIALDSYVGAGSGLKDLLFLISTPIGANVAFSGGKGKMSFSIMPTVLDIGPLVSYRFKNSEGEIPKIYLKEIFSPGIFGSVGFNQKLPVFFNFGWQKPASLQGVSSTENTYNLKPYDLFSATIAVNIPLLTLFHK